MLLQYSYIAQVYCYNTVIDSVVFVADLKIELLIYLKYF